MALQLEYRAETSVPVEVEGLVPAAVCGRPLAEIEQWPIFHGNRQVPLAEMFRVRGSAEDGRIDFSGDLGGVHWIGAKMTGGVIHVAGPAGRHLGSEMSGGEIHVEGDAGDWVGGEMHGGLIHVHRSAGHLVGAAYRGSARGMSGGVILIGGSAGNEIGHTMRRGLVAVGGDCGDFAGIGMIAGTILVGGSCGIRPAAGMRRGTLALLGRPPERLLPTFRRAGRCRPAFMRLYLSRLRQFGFSVADDWLDAEYTLYSGDLVTVGKGEILVRGG